MTERISLPAPLLSADFVERHEGDDTAAALRALGEAIAREKALDSLALARDTHQGVKLVTARHEAEDARADADEALDARTAQWDDLTRMAHEVKARDAAIDVLAGMVARLLTEK